MAKKKVDPQDVSVEEKLATLYKLQAVMSEVDRIRTIRGELPIEVQELEDEIEGRKTRKQKYEAQIETLNHYISERKHRVEESKALIERYNQQLESVRNNREYEALQKEVEYQTLEIQFSEKKINEDKESIEQLKTTLATLEEDTEGRMQDLENKRQELDAIVAETKQDEEQLLKEAARLEELIDPRILAAFKRTRKASRNGLAVVSIDREACTGCFNRIPPQRQLDVKLRKKVIVCEYCGRILVDPEMVEEIDGGKSKKKISAK